MRTNYNTTYSTTQYLTAAAECVLNIGYIKSDSSEISTKEKAKTLYSLGYIEDGPFLYLDLHDSEAKDLALNALNWIDRAKPENDFIRKLQEVCSKEEIKESELGIAASLIVAYQNHLAFEAKKAAKLKEQQKLCNSSDYQGNIGDKLTIKVKEFKIASSWDSEWGYTFLYQILDEHDNVFIWKTTAIIDDIDTVKSTTGTVKDHKEFNGIKQTFITRCKVNE